MSNTLRDPNQIQKAEHDEKNDAKRVYVINNNSPSKVIEHTIEKIVDIRIVEIENKSNKNLMIAFFISQLIILTLSKILL